MLGFSDQGTLAYGSPYYGLVNWPNVDETKCAITVQATKPNGEWAMTTFTHYYGYIYARAAQVVGGNTTPASGFGLEIVAFCGPSYTS